MSVEIKKVESRKDLKTFVRFPEKLYGDNPYYVPALVFDEMDTLNPKKNPASSFCESALYLAYKDGKVAGRVAAIVNNKANSQWDHKEVRFGWYDFIDDREVSKALMDKVIEFGNARNMDSVVGPLGFTDFDPEGMLVEGFDQMNTMPLIYNAPYYKDHVEAMGFEKEIDWVEFKVIIPDQLPPKFDRVSKIVSERYNVHTRKLTRKLVRKEDYGRKLFNLINETYKNLYNFTILPDELADKYLGFYLSVLDLKFVTMVENEKNELIAFGISMPSLAKALQKSRGKLFPFGWYHILKAMYFKHEGAELLLIGVRPDYQNTGINSLVVAGIFNTIHEHGIKWAETNAILETNHKNQTQFDQFETVRKKRRRSYKKSLKND